MFDNKTILITGGTGSLGRKLTDTLLKRHSPKKVIVFSRDELKQYEMQALYANEQRLRFFIGDVRDSDRLNRAFSGVDYVVHAAALKQVPAAEYNPFEAIKTNVIGAQNIIEAAMNTGVKHVVALSTDKAAAPINLYGATKLCSDKLFVAANNYKGARDIKFSVVRYGNVMGSRGSVIPFFLDKRKSGTLPITHREMTRFNISLEDGVKMIFFAFERAMGGEIFVPKIPSYRILTLAEAIAPSCRLVDVGIRPGEKLHEEMITESDSHSTIQLGQYFAIVPTWVGLTHYLDHHQAHLVDPGFSYDSGRNSEWLEVAQIRNLIREQVDSNFQPL
jgi:UDP-N-acetylglucosamine 4,6-dehydratase